MYRHVWWTPSQFYAARGKCLLWPSHKTSVQGRQQINFDSTPNRKMLIQDLSKMLVYTCHYMNSYRKRHSQDLLEAFHLFKGCNWVFINKEKSFSFPKKSVSFCVKSTWHQIRMCKFSFSLNSVISISALWLFKQTFGDIKGIFCSTSTYWKLLQPAVFANKSAIQNRPSSVRASIKLVNKPLRETRGALNASIDRVT